MGTKPSSSPSESGNCIVKPGSCRWSPVTLNATIRGLKFFFDIILNSAELMARMQPVHVSRTLPVILSREEAGRLIAAARNLKHQTILSVA